MIINIGELAVADRQAYLQHVIAPRPICLASTVDGEGNANLSPFSFFNLFSANPPIVVFSPSRRVRNNTTKDTLENVARVPEVVIHIVDYDMVQQVSLASGEYAAGVDEFLKAGFTKEPALIVRPPMVKESRAKMECRVLEIKSLGAAGGAGQLVICEVLVLHVDDSLLDNGNKIDPAKLDLVARLGGDWYCRVLPETLFRVPKPSSIPAMGIDLLPPAIRNSDLLTGNELALLANVVEVPLADRALQTIAMEHCQEKLGIRLKPQSMLLHYAAKYLIGAGKVDWAWQLLLPGCDVPDDERLTSPKEFI